MRKIKKYANVFAYNTLAAIGGIEQFFYEIACKYGDKYDITILYCKTNNEEQVTRLKKVLGEDKVIKYEMINGSYPKIYCKTLFLSYIMTPFVDTVQADKVYTIIHSDYEKINIPIPKHPKIDEYIAVSKSVEAVVKRMDNTLKTHQCYNPVNIRQDDTKRVLLLISATRLSMEKGKKRMEQFASYLDKANIPYLWLIFTNDRDAIPNKNIIYMNPRLDIRPFIKMVGDAGGYTVQLSDSESYCYTIVESLLLKTPVIVTDIPVFKEIGIDERNGFVLDMDLSNLDVQAIYEKRFKVDYTAKNDTYGKYLSKSKTENIDVETTIVKAVKRYYDVYEDLKIVDVGTYSTGRYIYVGQTYETTKDRAKLLVEKGFAIYG